jgi:hypothetical protein
VSANLCPEEGKTRINLVTQEWDHQVKVFASKLRWSVNKVGLQRQDQSNPLIWFWNPPWGGKGSDIDTIRRTNIDYEEKKGWTRKNGSAP